MRAVPSFCGAVLRGLDWLGVQGLPACRGVRGAAPVAVAVCCLSWGCPRPVRRLAQSSDMRCREAAAAVAACRSGNCKRSSPGAALSGVTELEGLRVWVGCRPRKGGTVCVCCVGGGH